MKPMRARNGIELRQQARSRKGAERPLAEEAQRELRRRVGNLRGAVIPAWEFELRGPRPSDWVLW